MTVFFNLAKIGIFFLLADNCYICLPGVWSWLPHGSGTGGKWDAPVQNRGVMSRKYGIESPAVPAGTEEMPYAASDGFGQSQTGSQDSAQLPPMAFDGIRAGFPSPAQDYMRPCIDLNRELVRHPAATFYGRVVGDSMIDAGVEEGDILVIDKSIEASEGDMCVCFVDGEFTLKYISFRDPSPSASATSAVRTAASSAVRTASAVWLLPANDSYPPIRIENPDSFIVWGVVTYVIKKTYRR